MTKATDKFDMHGLDMATKHMSVQESEAATIGEKRALASKSHRGSLANVGADRRKHAGRAHCSCHKTLFVGRNALMFAEQSQFLNLLRMARLTAARLI